MKLSFSTRPAVLLSLALSLVALSGLIALPAEAITHRHHSTSAHSSHSSSSSHSHSRSSHSSTVTASHGRRHHGSSHEIAHSRHHHGHKVAVASRAHYAYPIDFFMAHPPAIETDPLPYTASDKISRSFQEGAAQDVPARSLIRAGIVHYHPLRGGIFWRREPVKYVIVHSTETGIPIGAERVIDSWSSLGMRHPGAQYVVERDGTIYQAVDPDMGTVHVNIFKTLPGINNDNSIGIEMCHTGSQDYPIEQRTSVIRLVSYLQDRYGVGDDNVITHRYAQQGDHTDPVHFDWDGFLADKSHFRTKAIAYKSRQLGDETREWATPAAPQAPTFLQPHMAIDTVTTVTTTTTVRGPAGGPSLRGPIEMAPEAVDLDGSAGGSVAPGAVRQRSLFARPTDRPVQNAIKENNLEPAKPPVVAQPAEQPKEPVAIPKPSVKVPIYTPSPSHNPDDQILPPLDTPIDPDQMVPEGDALKE